MTSHALDLSPAAPRISTAFRIQFSVLLLLAGWSLAAFSSPLIQESSAWASSADALGWTLFTLGAALRFWSICHIAGRKTRVVVDSGPYALCRNPLYAGTFLIVASEAAFLKSAWFLLALVALVAFYQRFVIPSEEWKLFTRRGGDFASYAARVPRWFPNSLDRRCLEPSSICDRSAVTAELTSLVCWSIVPLLGILTCYCRAQPWWPHYVPGF